MRAGSAAATFEGALAGYGAMRVAHTQDRGWQRVLVLLRGWGSLRWAARCEGARVRGCEVRVVGVEGDTQLSQVNGGRWMATQRRRWSETGMRWLAVSIADSCTRSSGDGV